jgi:CrcB protein
LRKFIYIGIGGFFGAAARYIMGISLSNGNIPFSTFIINICGAFFSAYFIKKIFKRFKIGAEFRFGLTVGFFGAFTTFSGICKEAADMLDGGHYLFAFLYLAATIILGMAASYCGIILARKDSLRKLKVYREASAKNKKVKAG